MSTPFIVVTERMLEAGKFKNMSALARALEITPQALSNYKKREEMPTSLVVRFAQIYGLSIDYLITGAGPALRADSAIDSMKSIGITPDEGVAVFQTLKVLRREGPTALALKSVLDAFYSQQLKEDVCQRQS